MKQEPLPDNSSILPADADSAAGDLLAALTGHFSGGIATEEFEPQILANVRKELARGDLVTADMVREAASDLANDQPVVVSRPPGARVLPLRETGESAPPVGHAEGAGD